MSGRFNCKYCSFTARDNYNLNRHINSKKCKNARATVLGGSGLLWLDSRTIDTMLTTHLRVADFLDGEEGVASRVYEHYLKGKYKLFDSSRKKFGYYCGQSGALVIDINCSKLRKELQPFLNKKIEEWWIFFEPLPVFLQEKVLSNKELGNLFTKTILELAV